MEPPDGDNNNGNNTVLVFRASTRATLSNLLNPMKLLPNEKGVPRDWHGLAEKCGISGELIRSISNDQDPTAKVLQLWSEQWKSEATISKLMGFLEELDRPDVVDDVSPLIAEDLKFFQDSLVNGKSVPAFDLELDKHILTRDDVFRMQEGLEPQRYDAFVLFDDDDIAFATEIIDNMEKNYDMKFCIKERDLVAGGSEHDAVIRLIAERCARLIVVISPAFFESNANKFFFSVAQSISIEQRQRKIIPCIYKDCGKLPPELDCYFKLDIRRSGVLWNFWEKLRDSIIVPQKTGRNLLSLPENRLIAPADISAQSSLKAASRSASNSDQSLSSAGQKTVKFCNNMNSLPGCNSASSASVNGFEGNVARKNSLLQRIKSSFTPKSRSNQLQAEKPDELTQPMDEISTVDENNQKNMKQVEKKKKKKISFRLKKKKVAVLADSG